MIKFCLGAGFLLVSIHYLVKLAERISRIFRISPLIVGITMVAWGTSAPELVVSLIAALEGDMGLAMGNIIGSNIANVFLVLPAGIFIRKIRIGTTKTQRNALALLGITGLFICLQKLAISYWVSGIVLLTLAVITSIVELCLGINGRKHEDLQRFKKIRVEKLDSALLAGAILALAGVIGGGILLVAATEGISDITDYSTTFLGLTAVAVVTSLPELATTIFSQKDHEDKIAIGNIIGSNIYNLIFVGGIISLFPAGAKMGVESGIWLAISTIVLVLILKIFSGKQVPKKIGIGLLLLFLWYLTATFL